MYPKPEQFLVCDLQKIKYMKYVYFYFDIIDLLLFKFCRPKSGLERKLVYNGSIFWSRNGVYSYTFHCTTESAAAAGPIVTCVVVEIFIETVQHEYNIMIITDSYCPHSTADFSTHVYVG